MYAYIFWYRSSNISGVPLPCLLPAWATATIAYLVLARSFGAAKQYPQAEIEEETLAMRKAEEARYLASGAPIDESGGHTLLWWGLQAIGFLSLAWMLVSGAQLLFVDAAAYPGALAAFRENVIWPSLVFFACAALAVIIRGEKRELS